VVLKDSSVALAAVRKPKPVSECRQHTAIEYHVLFSKPTLNYFFSLHCASRPPGPAPVQRSGELSPPLRGHRQFHFQVFQNVRGPKEVPQSDRWSPGLNNGPSNDHSARHILLKHRSTQITNTVNFGYNESQGGVKMPVISEVRLNCFLT
jgi:hypothetical protein